MKEQEEWKKLITRWESEEIQSNLFWWAQRYSQDDYPQCTSYIDDFGRMLMAFGCTIYHHAYSFDNMTRFVYYTLWSQLLHRDESYIKDEDKQYEKFVNTIRKKMPKGLQDYSENSGYLSVPDGKNLTLKKASEFLDFLESDEYKKIMQDIV